MRKKVILLLCLSVLSLGLEAQENREQEINKYIEIYKNGTATEQINASQQLEWAGLSDQRIFDQVQKELIEIYPNSSGNRNSIDHAAWLTKALSYSGDEKYRETIQEIADKGPHRKLKKYAKIHLKVISDYTTWNPIINDTSLYDPKESPEDNRFVNMLRSDELELKRLAAKRIHYKHIYNDFLLNIAAEEVTKSYKKETGDKLHIDTFAWLCKALGGSRDTSYKDLIEEVSNNAGDKKLRKYAKKYLKYYQ